MSAAPSATRGLRHVYGARDLASTEFINQTATGLVTVLQVAAPLCSCDARALTLTLQMLAAIPIGAWMVVFCKFRLTSPPCWLFEPPPPRVAVALGLPVALQGAAPFASSVASTLTATLQTLAATAMGNPLCVLAQRRPVRPHLP